MSKILITPKINPDLDGVACAYAYAKFLNITQKENQYVAGIYGKPQVEARFLLEKLKINNGLVYNPEDNFDKFIIVDASDVKGMPSIMRPLDVIEVIDHRETHKAMELFPNANIQIEPVGAAATLIFEKFKEISFPFDENIMFLLYGAIFSNTLNFKSDIVSDRDVEAVKFIGNNLTSLVPSGMIDEMFKYKTEYIIHNFEEVIKDDFKIFDYNGKLGIAQIEGFDFENLINIQKEQISDVLKKIKDENQLNYIFLTAADIKNGYNIFLVIDEITKRLLAGRMGLIFNADNVARNSKLLLRKQILPLII